MLYLTTVTKWQSDRDSKGRVGAKDKLLGRKFIINTDRITNLTAMDSQTTGVSFSKFNFTENPGSRRESQDYLEVQATVHEIEHGHNTVPTSLFISLPVFVNNDHNRASVTTTITVASIVYADSDNVDDSHTWVLYMKDGFKKARVLVDLNIIQIFDLISNPLLDMDGNAYTTVTIGSQEWTVQNLRTSLYANGVSIPYIQADMAWVADVTGAYCYYNHDPKNGEAYGNLYNWYAVNNANGLAYFARNGVQEVGWRVPTVADYTTLSTALGGDIVSGVKLKESGTLHWDFYSTTLGTDQYEFRDVGCGNRFVDDHTGTGFVNINVFSDKWTQDALNAVSAYSVYCTFSSIDFDDWDHEKYGGMGVRCVRDV